MNVQTWRFNLSWRCFNLDLKDLGTPCLCPYLHVYALQLTQLSCANFMEFLLQFCLMIEVMIAAKNTLVLVWCSAGCHRSVTFACPLAQEGVHPRMRLWLNVSNSY